MGNVTIYSAESCVACKTVMSRFDSKGVEYTKEMLEDHPDVAAMAREKGFMSLPVMQFETSAGMDVVAGPSACLEKIKELAKA